MIEILLVLAWNKVSDYGIRGLGLLLLKALPIIMKKEFV